MQKVKVRILVSFGGLVCGYDSPQTGDIILLAPDLARALVETTVNGICAEYVMEEEVPECAMIAPPKGRVRPKPRSQSG